jgi:hypothetical protein
MQCALVGSSRFGSGCLVLRADTRENLGSKNGVITGTCFEMKDLGPLRYFLGIGVNYSSSGYTLSQVKHASDLIS